MIPKIRFTIKRIFPVAICAGGGQGGNRTLMGLLPQDFESCASTNSATRPSPTHIASKVLPAYNTDDPIKRQALCRFDDLMKNW